MSKLTVVAAIFLISATTAFADDVHSISTTLFSGTAQNPLASFVNTTDDTLNISVKTWYVDPASGSASNRSAPAIQLGRTSNWVFDFTNPAAVSFTGTLEMGSYRAQTTVDVRVTADGRQTASGVVHSFSGIGAYDEATNTFTYNFLNSVANGGGGSTYSAAAPMTCANGQASAAGSVCSFYLGVSPGWEELALSFVFAEDRNSFTGSLQGTNYSGVGLGKWSTQINWYAAEVPLPAGGWLFGSSLVALGASGCRRLHRGRYDPAKPL